MKLQSHAIKRLALSLCLVSVCIYSLVLLLDKRDDEVSGEEGFNLGRKLLERESSSMIKAKLGRKKTIPRERLYELSEKVRGMEPVRGTERSDAHKHHLIASLHSNIWCGGHRKVVFE